MANVYALGDAAQRAAVTLREGLDRLADIWKRGRLRLTARFGIRRIIAGHTILTVGVAMVLVPVLTHIAFAALLGLIVGAAKALNQGRPILAVPMPVAAAALVSVLVLYAEAAGPGGGSAGRAGTAAGDVPARGPAHARHGGARVRRHGERREPTHHRLRAAGPARVRPRRRRHPGGRRLRGAVRFHGAARQGGFWVPWAGVLLCSGSGSFSTSRRRETRSGGCSSCCSSRSRPSGWPPDSSSGEISGFFGMLVATPLSYLIQLRFKGPPAMVTFLPSFWLVVPGSFGLFSVTADADRSQGGAGRPRRRGFCAWRRSRSGPSSVRPCTRR